jgi:hypothetical protein
MQAISRKLGKPFMLGIIALSAFCTAPVLATVPRGELEYYDYGELILTSTITTENNQLACFVTPQHKAVWAHQGDYIGKYFGKISGIDVNSVTISEKIIVNNDEWIERSFKWPLTNNKKPSDLCTSPPIKIQPNNARKLQ